MIKLHSLLFFSLHSFSAAFAQEFNIGLVCKNGTAQYKTSSGWKTFVLIELPRTSALRLKKGSSVQVMEIIRLTDRKARKGDEKSYIRTYMHPGDSIITHRELALGLSKISESHTEQDSSPLNVLFQQLFSGKQIPTREIGSVGGTRRGKGCPVVQLVDPDMESLYSSRTVQLSWHALKDPGTRYAIRFFSDRDQRDQLWNTVFENDTLTSIDLPSSLFDEGQVYYWTVAGAEADICGINALRILTGQESREINQFWEETSRKEGLQSPLREVIKAEFLSINGLFFEASLVYRQVPLRDFPELVSQKDWFDTRMNIKLD